MRSTKQEIMASIEDSKDPNGLALRVQEHLQTVMEDAAARRELRNECITKNLKKGNLEAVKVDLNCLTLAVMPAAKPSLPPIQQQAVFVGANSRSREGEDYRPEDERRDRQQLVMILAEMGPRQPYQIVMKFGWGMIYVQSLLNYPRWFCCHDESVGFSLTEQALVDVPAARQHVKTAANKPTKMGPIA